MLFVCYLGKAPIHSATIEGHLDVVRMLTRHDPKTIQIKDMSGETAYDIAVRKAHTHVADFLKEFQEGDTLYLFI